MDKDKLEEGNSLRGIIESTKEGLCGLKEMMKEVECDEKTQDNKFDDGLYKLVISKNSDRSGKGAEFVRYKGNVSLLRVMIAHTEEQLIVYEEAFKNL